MMISPILLNIMDTLCDLCELEEAQATGRETNIRFELSADLPTQIRALPYAILTQRLYELNKPSFLTIY